MGLMRAALLVLALCAASANAHGNMVFPRPRSAHDQTLDARNKCGCADEPGGCYSRATSPGYYCGLGCIGEACLYYQIGCYQSCPSCSYVGKTLYPVPEDLVKAGNCPTPPAPTLGGGDPAVEHALRTYNIDNDSELGDWTKWNPWRSPGTAGLGNPQFQPCGVNSGSNVTFPDPPAAGQPQFANGTALPETPRSNRTVWTAGSVVEAEWAIYANHGGGYSYRLCRKDGSGSEATEACYSKTPLRFASSSTTIRYHDGSRPDFLINATTTSEGTWPVGSEWRKNPIPMCNCDIGEGCVNVGERFEGKLSPHAVQMMHGKTDTKAKVCHAVTDEAQCGQDLGVNTCLKCNSSAPFYDCIECCPGLTKVTKGGYTFCWPNGPKQKCDPSKDKRECYSQAYKETYLRPGQSLSRCKTGVMFPTQWDDGHSGFVGGPGYSMTDQVIVPSDLEPGEYSLSFRWDCEQTPQVWNSCADVTITTKESSR